MPRCFGKSNSLTGLWPLTPGLDVGYNDCRTLDDDRWAGLHGATIRDVHRGAGRLSVCLRPVADGGIHPIPESSHHSTNAERGFGEAELVVRGLPGPEPLPVYAGPPAIPEYPFCTDAKAWVWLPNTGDTVANSIQRQSATPLHADCR